MTFSLPKRLPILVISGILVVTLGGCQSTGSGISSVTCETIRIVKLSRRDTTDTIKQVVPNNAALAAICGRSVK